LYPAGISAGLEPVGNYKLHRSYGDGRRNVIIYARENAPNLKPPTLQTNDRTLSR
jgi:hypothetical protein